MELIFDKEGCKGITKGPAIYEKNGNCLTPVVYFRKPKNVSKEKFELVIRVLIDRSKNK